MKLSLHTDYGLRVLMRLACSPAGERITIDEIARGFEISHSHLTKVVQSLAREGFVLTARGRDGGLCLSTPPSEIVVGAVVRALEANHALVECHAAGGGRCVVAPACGLNRVLAEAQVAFFAVLDAYTLQMLVRSPSRFRALLRA